MMGRSILQKFRIRLFPTERERIARKWFKDGGDRAHRYDYELNEDAIVLDLGGYQGEWSETIHSKYGCKILIFEPVPHFAKIIARRFSGNNAFEVHGFGLGGKTREETITLSENGSSIFREGTSKQKILIQDADSWLKERFDHSQMIDLVKINIEGGEYELLPRLIESGWTLRIKELQIQFHDYLADAEKRMQAIQQALAYTHETTYQYKFVWENWKRKRPPEIDPTNQTDSRA